MKAKNSTGDVIVLSLVGHYLWGEFPQERERVVRDIVLSKQSRIAYSGLTNHKVLSALFGLPPNGDLLHRDAWLYKAANRVDQITGRRISASELARHLAAFRSDHLTDWLRDLRAAGEMPGMVPLSARSSWINRVIKETNRHVVSKNESQVHDGWRLCTQDYMIRAHLFYAFASTTKIPRSARALSSIINQNFDGAAGELRQYLYEQITSFLVV